MTAPLVVYSCMYEIQFFVDYYSFFLLFPFFGFVNMYVYLFTLSQLDGRRAMYRSKLIFSSVCILFCKICMIWWLRLCGNEKANRLKAGLARSGCRIGQSRPTCNGRLSLQEKLPYYGQFHMTIDHRVWIWSHPHATACQASLSERKDLFVSFLYELFFKARFGYASWML